VAGGEGHPVCYNSTISRGLEDEEVNGKNVFLEGLQACRFLYTVFGMMQQGLLESAHLTDINSFS